MARLTRFHGRPCPYCARPMSLHSAALVPTRDHVIPKIKGGREILVCCKFCNNLKGHMMPEEWDAFRAAFTGYWKMLPRDRRAALAKHKRDYVPSNTPWRASPTYRGRRPIVVPPELIWHDQHLRDLGKRIDDAPLPNVNGAAG